MFLVLLVNVSVCPPEYSKSNERICIKLSPKVCFWRINIRLNFGMIQIETRMQDPHYDQITWISRRSKILFQSNCMEDYL